MTDVAQFFDALAADYTASIERCVPRYREMLCTLLAYLPQDRPSPSILELGCGNGNLSALLAQAFPSSRMCLVDVSSDSLDACRNRLGSMEARIEFRREDFRSLTGQRESFDLVLSSIAIHHLTSPEKIALFEKAHFLLAAGGVLAFADQCRGATDQIYSRHIAAWKAQAMMAGASEGEFEMWMSHQRQFDHHDTLGEQLNWLLDAGFTAADCVWRYLLWSVVIANKG